MSSSRLVVRNVLSSFATQIISWILTFAVTLYLPRYVGAAGLGKLAFATSFVAMFGVIVPLGTSFVLARDIARDRSRAGELLVAAIILRLCTGIVLAAAATGLVYALGYPPITRLLVMVTAAGMVVFTLNDAVANALKGQENLPRQNVAVLVDKTLSSAATIILVIMKAPLWSIAAVTLFSVAVSLLVNMSAFTHLLPQLRLPTIATFKYIVSAGMPFCSVYVLQALYGQSDPIVISLIANDRTVGWYAAEVRLGGAAMIIPIALTAALFPTLSRLYKDNKTEFQTLARRAMAAVILWGVPLSIVFISIPDRILALIHYPHDFAGTVPVMRVGGVGVLLFSVALVVGTTVMASDRQAKVVKTFIVACFIGIPVCFLLTYLTNRYWANGAIGAAMSDILLEFYLIAAYLHMVPEGTFSKESMSLVIKALIASLPLVALLRIFQGTESSLVAICIGFILYLGLCWRMKCIDPQYFVMARRYLRRNANS